MTLKVSSTVASYFVCNPFVAVKSVSLAKLPDVIAAKYSCSSAVISSLKVLLLDDPPASNLAWATAA